MPILKTFLAFTAVQLCSVSCYRTVFKAWSPSTVMIPESSQPVYNRSLLLFEIPLELRRTQYIGEIMIGTPAQKFKCIIDTGSLSSWITSTECTSETCLTHARFDKKISTTFTEQKESKYYDLHYNSGKLTIVKGSDKICFSNFCINDQEFGLAVHEDPNPFRTMEFDGLMGLGPGSRSESLIFKMNRLAESRYKKNLLFFFDLNGVNGLFYGIINPRSESESVELRDVNWFKNGSHQYWTLPLLNIFINNVPLNLCVSQLDSICKAIVDTGTSNIMGDETSVKMIRRLAQLDSEDCSTSVTLPNISFHFLNIDGETVKINLKLSQVLNNPILDTLYCDVGIITGTAIPISPDEKTSWVLGANFLRNLKLILDPESRLIGLKLK